MILLAVALAAVGLLGIHALRKNWSPTDVVAAQCRGDQLVLLLTTYREQHGQYPESLKLLALPDSLARPAAGRRVWKYRTTDERQQFVLGVSAGGPLAYERTWFVSRQGACSLDV
jgi:hypothetical protein